MFYHRAQGPQKKPPSYASDLVSEGYDCIVIGAGITGLNVARLVTKPNRRICLAEASNRCGGLVQTKFVKLPDPVSGRTASAKLESGGAVVYSYQTEMLRLIAQYDLDVDSFPLNRAGRHHKDFYTSSNGKLGETATKRYKTLLGVLFDHMDYMGSTYCNEMTLEQLSMEIMTFEDARFIQFCYGYVAEFQVANANVARKNIQNELDNSDRIFYFKDGFNTLTDQMCDSIRDSVDILYNHKVVAVVRDPTGGYTVRFANQPARYCKCVVFAVPQQALLMLDHNTFTRPERVLMRLAVQRVSLTRMFAQYDMSKSENQWMNDLRFSTTDNPLQQIIPIQKKLGLFQVSYSDWVNADLWGQLPSDRAPKIVHGLLAQTFPTRSIDEPNYFVKFYWPGAIHFWRPGVEPAATAKRIALLRSDMFVAGETFSTNQGWCEGAVQTSQRVAAAVNKFLAIH